MNIWLKDVSEKDDLDYFNLLMELANYSDVYARPVPSDFSFDDYETFKRVRVQMRTGDNLPKSVMPTSTYWVMDNEVPIGYATLKHKVDPNKPGGHFGLCLKKEYQNKGIGTIVSQMLSKIAYEDLGIEEVIYTSKDENIQSQKSLEKIGAVLIDIHDGYHYYTYDLAKHFAERKER